MEVIHYPVRGRKLEETVTQKTLDSFYSTMETWRQDVGVIGHLALHACWGTASVLDKRYQGETCFLKPFYLKFYMEMYDRFHSFKWKNLADSLVSHLFYLQADNGGFIHSTSEFEPTFDTSGCPIHFFSPIMALCRYYEWKSADPELRAKIPDVIEKHWQFTLNSAWRVGNPKYHPLTFSGWCGVTNQDLTAVAATAMVGRALGKWDYFEQYGKPTLDVFLSDDFYYEDLGLFERGDGKNFPERLPYYVAILDRLRIIYDCVGDERIPPIIDNVISHLFDLHYVAADGMTHLSRGINIDPNDRSKVAGVDRSSIPVASYPGIALNLADYLTRHKDPEKERILEEFKSTIAGYMFSDACIPMAFTPSNPIFTIVSNTDVEGIGDLILSILGDRMEEPKVIPLPAVHRQYKNFTWKQNGRLWAIEKDGVRQYGGYTRYPAGITIGPDEAPVFGNFDSLQACDVLEIIDTELN